MPILENYNAFDGYYWYSSSIANSLAYAGYNAPHTNKPYSDALLFGISGSINFGYFYFHYDGYDPQINILTRNTFNWFDVIMDRLGIARDVLQTTSTDKGRKNLIEVLEQGNAPIVFADTFTLSYNAHDYDDGMWGMMPIVVYGYDDDTAYIADRADVGLTVTAQNLDDARARVKKDKQRLMTLSSPNEGKLAAAVTAGLWDCINLFTEKPPKGSANNFGFKAYQRWIELLTKPKKKGSWAKVLPTGRDVFAGLTTAFHFSQQFGKDDSYSAERALFTEFLAEAAVILDKPALADLAPQFQQAGDAWCALGKRLLPDDVPMLKEAREVMVKKHSTFLNQGNDALDVMHASNQRQNELLEASDDFPLDDDEITALQASIADQVQVIHDIEQDAIFALRDVMSS